jgi:alpha-N-arabinofuranosidase
MTADNNSTLAKLRRENGREKPWKVAFFGVGNETWGCGGNMRPEYYADLYRRYATFLKSPEGNRPKKVASGGNDEQTNWTEALACQAAAYGQYRANRQRAAGSDTDRPGKDGPHTHLPCI